MDDTRRIISKQILVDTANAIRAKKGTSSSITPSDFANEIDSIVVTSTSTAAISTKASFNVFTSNLSTKTWTGLRSFNGSEIWTDGENIYYSYQTKHYVLDKATSTWSKKTWYGLSSFAGSNIWTDGENIYY